jgi:hypothetical protein
MVKYLPLLFLLACPLMMMFMMRGMSSGGRSVGHDVQEPDADGHKGFGPAEDIAELSVPTPHERERIARLEREVAELRAARERAVRGNTSFHP